MTLPVSEVFHSFQGEGPHAGRICYFIRLGGCNLSCGYGGGWNCDSAYTWDSRNYDLRKELTATGPDSLVGQVEANTMVVITGGEPLIHQRNDSWATLLRELSRNGNEIHVETNGTICPDAITETFVAHFSVSPKFMATHKPGQNPLLADWSASLRHHRAVLKFVVTCPDDIDAAVVYATKFGWPLWRVWVMPEGTTPEKLLDGFDAIVERAAKLGVNVSQRLHVLAFGNKRGV